LVEFEVEGSGDTHWRDLGEWLAELAGLEPDARPRQSALFAQRSLFEDVGPPAETVAREWRLGGWGGGGGAGGGVCRGGFCGWVVGSWDRNHPTIHCLRLDLIARAGGGDAGDHLRQRVGLLDLRRAHANRAEVAAVRVPDGLV